MSGAAARHLHATYASVGWLNVTSQGLDSRPALVANLGNMIRAVDVHRVAFCEQSRTHSEEVFVVVA